MIKYKAAGMVIFRRVWDVKNVKKLDSGAIIVLGERKTVLIPSGAVIIAKGHSAEEMLQNAVLGPLESGV